MGASTDSNVTSPPSGTGSRAAGDLCEPDNIGMSADSSVMSPPSAAESRTAVDLCKSDCMGASTDLSVMPPPSGAESCSAGGLAIVEWHTAQRAIHGSPSPTATLASIQGSPSPPLGAGEAGVSEARGLMADALGAVVPLMQSVVEHHTTTKVESACVLVWLLCREEPDQFRESPMCSGLIKGRAQAPKRVG